MSKSQSSSLTFPADVYCSDNARTTGSGMILYSRGRSRLDRIIESKQVSRIPTFLQRHQRSQILRSVPRVNALVSVAVAHVGLQAIESARLREKRPDIRREVAHDVVDRRVIIRVAKEPGPVSESTSFLLSDRNTYNCVVISRCG